jgi:cytochrome P450
MNATNATTESSNIGAPVVDVDPYAHETLLDPYPMHERLREAGPVVYIPKYGIYAVARHEQVVAVFANHAVWISSAGVGLTNFRTEKPFRPPSLILEADPPQHTQTRAILSRILSPKTVMTIRAEFQRVAEEMVDRCVQMGEIDAIADLAQIYPLKVFPDAVGLGEDGRENLLAYGDLVFNSMGPRNELLAKSAARAAEVTDWIMAHCDRSALRPGGFGDQIYQAADNGEISHEQAPMLVRSFLSAGVDTTINGLGNAIYSLAAHPGEYARLHADPSLARGAFEEALRFESTAQTFFRTAVCDTELAGVPIPENSKMLCLLAAANRDPRKWPEPDRYDILRRPAGHQAFGSGIHGCVGQVIARLEGELVLTALAKRVKSIEILTQPTRRLNNTLRAIDTMRLRLTPA